MTAFGRTNVPKPFFAMPPRDKLSATMTRIKFWAFVAPLLFTSFFNAPGAGAQESLAGLGAASGMGATLGAMGAGSGMAARRSAQNLGRPAAPGAPDEGIAEGGAPRFPGPSWADTAHNGCCGRWLVCSAAPGGEVLGSGGWEGFGQAICGFAEFPASGRGLAVGKPAVVRVKCDGGHVVGEDPQAGRLGARLSQ